jgi:hypothetical protein
MWPALWRSGPLLMFEFKRTAKNTASNTIPLICQYL